MRDYSEVTKSIAAICEGETDAATAVWLFRSAKASAVLPHGHKKLKS